MDRFVPQGFNGDDRYDEEPAFAALDMVNHPKHYVFSKYEVIDVLVDWNMDFLLGNVIKYVARAGRKGSKSEDLKKARVYLERAILEAEVDEAKLA